MEEELEDVLRRQYPVFRNLVDEEVRQLEHEVGRLPQTPDALRVANYAELLALREKVFPGMRQIGMFPTGYDLKWQGSCELLFIDQQYGPCCIWARATAEMILQEMCFSSPDTRGKFEAWIQGHSGHNPGVKRCMEILGPRLTADDREGCTRLADYGDWQVHHRIDKIVGDMSYEDVLRELGVSDENLKKPGFKKHERLLTKGFRERKSREMAVTSMRELYGLLSRRGNGQTP